jgi:fumarate hydratase class II
VAAQVIGNDAAITVGGLQGQFELNVRIPLIARNLLQSIHLLSTASLAFAEKCVDGIEVNKDGAKRSAESTLAVATALNEHIGYDKATTIVKKAAESGRMLRDVALEEGVDEELYDRVIDLRRIAAGSQADQQPDGKPARAKRSGGSGSSSNGGARRRRTQRASA